MKENKKIHTFVTKRVIGKCPLCTSNVYEDNLFTEKNNEIFHLSCHNNKIKEDKEK